MFERFTDRSRRVIVLCQEEARKMNHNYVGTEHVLLGLLAEGEGVAATVLHSLDLSADIVRAKIYEIVGSGAAPVSGHIPFTPRAKKLLENSLREALRLGHNYIGTEHLLLALVTYIEESVGVQILTDLGLTPAGVRQLAIEALARYGPPARGDLATERARLLQSLTADLARVAGSGMTHGDWARDLLHRYDISLKA
ncbi:hypothetical protein H7J86_24375 [Mycobacterium hackensackense]|nr:hypothetical protein [Mycobacterium hackensackense]